MPIGKSNDTAQISDIRASGVLGRHQSGSIRNGTVRQFIGILAFGGIFFVVGAGFLVVAITQEVPAALDELALIRSGEAVSGRVTESDFDRDDGEEWWSITYSYTMGGPEYEGTYKDETDWRVPSRYVEAGSPIELEYSTDHPSISRPLGTGHDSFLTWFLARVLFIGVVMGLGCLALAVGTVAWLVGVGMLVRSVPIDPFPEQ